MKRILLCSGIIGLCILLYTLDSQASRIGGQILIDGTDALCQGYTPTVVSGNNVFTCIPSGTAPGAPTNCVATVNSSSTAQFTSAGGVANLSVACTQTTGVTYNWSRNSSPGANTNRTWADTLPSNGGGTAVNYTYQVAACINAACVTVPGSPLVATVAASGSFSGTCPGFDNTIILTQTWASPTRQFASMGPNDIVIVQFTTGNVATTGSLVRIAAGEYNSPPSSRIAALSATPCDFVGLPNSAGEGNSPTFSFAISPGSGFGFYPAVAKNTTYYMNVKNSLNSTCRASGVCNMFSDLLKPGGL